MATLDKCTGIIPTDGSGSTNHSKMFEVSFEYLIIISYDCILIYDFTFYLNTNLLKSSNGVPKQIKQIETAVDCQWFCSEYYNSTCTWWMYDETNKYCKIFHGPQENLYEYCFELGFSSSPPVSECISAADPTSNNNCDVSLQDGTLVCKFHKCYINVERFFVKSYILLF